jgi:aspartate carbamoyltransferase catalytic subunit
MTPDRHLLSTAALPVEQALQILNTAQAFFEVGHRAVKKVPTLRGKTIINLFFESSTRTRTSFELAGKRLSADVINVSGSGSSTSKGETLRDTVETLDAMHPDLIVVRHSASGAAHYISQRSEAAIVNAGDGTHEHPTQALLDAFTIKQHKGDQWQNLTVAICGDVLHSRVARSNIHLLSKLGAKVRLAAPRTLLPTGIEQLGCTAFERIEPAIEGADVVMMLRIQRERLSGVYLPTLREYSREFGLNASRLKHAKADAIVMHPGPMNRGVEIADDVVESERSVILDQVEAGVAVRMAVLYLYSGSPTQSET